MAVSWVVAVVGQVSVRYRPWLVGTAHGEVDGLGIFKGLAHEHLAIFLAINKVLGMLGLP